MEGQDDRSYLNQGKNIVQIIADMLFDYHDELAELLKQEFSEINIRSANDIEKTRHDLSNVRDAFDTQ